MGNSVVNDLAQLKGQHEALQIGLEEAGQEMSWIRSRLGPVADFASGLEACRDRHIAEVEAAISAERHLALTAESRTSSIKKLGHASRLLAEEMRADHLIALFDMFSPHSDENVLPKGAADEEIVMLSLPSVMLWSQQGNQQPSSPVRLARRVHSIEGHGPDRRVVQ